MAKRNREQTIETIASEVGRIFGTTEAHARRWLAQRKQLVQALGAVRDRASSLIAELSGAPIDGIPVIQPGMRESRKRRVISAQTRAKMVAAAKKRWAARKKSV